ncbi:MULTISPECIES: sodium-dependent transporter [unclassified Adlercreutzia]|uniref:sodium-dependent transporter n=1 Tax=unclassified Adlercreutzia TaxID=2636013 RepID=UPI0013EB4D16|nr:MULTISPECIES: sodium-dependent transporter [unclassified Adlercreutzia]
MAEEISETKRKGSRDSFATRTGFILACVGSAVGMANIWLFPYRVAELGGAAFLIPYLLFVVLIGFTGVIGEMAFGRAAGTGPMGAFAFALEKRGVAHARGIGKAIGLIPTLGSLAIAIGYAVVLGWAFNYLVASFDGQLMAQESMGAFFGGIASEFGNVGFHVLGLAVTFAVMILGVSRGIERINKVLMPAFFVLFVIVVVRVATLPGASAGYEYLLVPRWEALSNPTTWVYALGQAFFSLSIAGNGTLVYGSYLKRDVDVVTSARNVAIFDTLAAMVAACAVVPAVFVFGLDVASGPPLMFITLPSVFQEMPFGSIFVVIFFIAVTFAAVTSLMNLFEAPVEALQAQFGLSRGVAVGIIAVVAVGVGLFLESGDVVSTWMDVVSIYVMPTGALLAAIMFFWVCPKGFAREQAQLGHDKPLGAWFDYLPKYVFVGITALVIVLGIFYGGIG